MNLLTSHLFRTCLLVILALSLLGFGHCASVTAEEAQQLRDEVKEMFYHAFDGYMKYAFPLDELRPKSCTGEDTLGGYSLTLIDSLDTLALFGDRERFSSAVEWLGNNLHFRKNKTVSVFETTIRILGGLLSAHLLASDDATVMRVNSYNNELLHLAEDLARRMLPAFETPTGIPYGSVNLLFGVDEHESKITSTAGGGTLTLEFGLLSRLTGDPVFENVTKNAVRGLWSQRSELNLVGAHINVFTGYWTQKDAGIGTSIDSFYEYLLKAHLLFGDEEYLYMFQEAYRAVMQYLFNDPWYVEVNMNSAAVVWPLFNSLQAFWPGLQALAGDVEPAARTHKAFFQVWKQYGFTPEGFNLATMTIQPGQRSYPLRPELIESTYWLYKATRDPSYLDVGRDILASLQHGARCTCGYCHIADVETHEQEDHMESFFLAETVKYLWLLFDLAMGGENMVEKGPYGYIFSTEGHLFPQKPSISLLPERRAMSQLVPRLNDRKSENRFANYETLLKHLTAMGKKKFNSKHRAIKGVCPAISHSRNYGLSSLADDLFTSKNPNEHPDDEAYYQDHFGHIKVEIRSLTVDTEDLIRLIINDNTSDSMENDGNDDSNETCIPNNKINYTQENSGDSSCKGHYVRNETCLADNILNNIIANVEDSFCKVHDESNETCIQGAPTEDESICKHLPNTNANEESRRILENR